MDLDLIGGSGNDFFAVAPVAVVSAMAGSTHASDARYQPQASVTGLNDIEVRFIDLGLTAASEGPGGGGSVVYVETEDSRMAFNILIFGDKIA
jgi:hypothetical protein